MENNRFLKGIQPEYATSRYPEDFLQELFCTYVDDNSKWVEKDLSYLKEIDPITEYSLNSMGYRSTELNQYPGADLVISGCSHTYGIGVPLSASWAELVAKKLNVSHVNLALPGISVQKIIKNLFAYFKKYGHPKKVICLFPDFGRMNVPINSKFNSSDMAKHDFNYMFINAHLHSKKDTPPKYSKAPHGIEDVFPYELPIYISVQLIHMLDQYCLAAGIEFLWSTWDGDMHEFILKNKDLNITSSFVDIGMQDWHANPGDDYSEIYHGDGVANRCDRHSPCSSGDGCHTYLRDTYGDVFYTGSDRMISRMHSHFGAHKHTHIAENFLKVESSAAHG